MTLDTLQAMVHSDWLATNKMIDDHLNSPLKLAREVTHYVKKTGGKRLRPLLVLLSAHAFHYTEQQHIPLATMLELLHNASLLHDDVIDDSDLRRGKQTIHKQWDNRTSILIGDLLLAKTFQILTDLTPPKDYRKNIAKLAANATQEAIDGEVLQLMNIQNIDLSEALYFDIVERKTAKLFEMAAIVGPVLTEENDDVVDLMLNFGKQIGIAFQLIDDVIDYDGSCDTIGKNIGDDLANGKLTLPLIYALKIGTTKQTQMIKNAIQQKNNLSDIITIVKETKAIDYTRLQAQQYATLAINSLEQLPQEINISGLQQYALFLTNRLN